MLTNHLIRYLGISMGSHAIRQAFDELGEEAHQDIVDLALAW